MADTMWGDVLLKKERKKEKNTFEIEGEEGGTRRRRPSPNPNPHFLPLDPFNFKVDPHPLTLLRVGEVSL